MYFAAVGYELRIENKKLTCHYKSQIGEMHNQDLSSCEKFCDQEESCNFFFFNDDGFCSLHFSCVDKRVPLVKGSTYETKNGNTTNFLYHLNNIELYNLDSNHSNITF